MDAGKPYLLDPVAASRDLNHRTKSAVRLAWLQPGIPQVICKQEAVMLAVAAENR
jgi:hypothetical protein